MADRDDISEIVEIDFEVGHTSTIRAEPTTIHNPPRTHDWKVYLRSADVHGDLSCLIQRCVFYLHPEFPNSKRELKSTPFAIQESGYAGFHLPIDIFFKTKKEPKKFRIEYDLDLHTNIEGHPHRQKESYVRKYRCTFYNPDPEFRQKILAAGGKIKDNNPIPTNNNDNEESEDEEEAIPPPPEPTVRHSPPQKRPFSPIPTVNSANIKKPKVEQSLINPKKKQQAVIKNENSSKLTVNNPNIKKSQLTLSIKPPPTTEEKITKNSNQTISSTNGSTEDSSLSKSRPSSKLKSDHDIKPSIQSSTNQMIKKKEAVPSPSKTSTQIPLKKPIQIPSNKPSQKISIKIEQTSSINKSPSNINIKRESSPNLTSSNSTTSTVLISSLKKIPKKVAPPLPPPPPPPMEKRIRSPMTPPSSNRNSDRDSHRHQSSSSKNHSTSKRDRPVTPPSSSSINNSTSSRSSSSNRSEKHRTSSSSNRGRSRSRTRSRSRSRSRNRSSHQTNHSSRSHHSSNSSRHSSQQKDRSSHQSSTSKSSSSHHNNRRTPTPPPPSSSQPKSTRSPSRSAQSHIDPLSSSNDLTIPSSTTSINTPQSRPSSVEPAIIPSTTCSPSAHIFQSEDDHTQTPMDIDGQSDDDINHHHHRQIRLSDEHDQISPLSSTKILTNRNFHSDHSYSLSDTNESNDDSNLSINDNDDDDDDDLPTVLTDDDLRTKLIFIYNRFTLSSTNDLLTFVTFFKRHHLIDISSKTSNGMFTYDLFSLNPLLIDELATDLGYTTNSIINRTEQ